MVEMALALPLFLLALSLLVETAIALYRISALEEALGITARDATIGVTDPGFNRVDTIKRRLQTRSQRLSINLDPSEISVCPGTNSTCSPENAGDPGGFVTLTARIPLTTLTLRSFNYRSSVTARNERF